MCRVCSVDSFEDVIIMNYQRYIIYAELWIAIIELKENQVYCNLFFYC